MCDVLDFAKGKRRLLVSEALNSAEGPAIVISQRKNDEGKMEMVIMKHGLSEKQAIQWLDDAAAELEGLDQA